MMTFAIQRLNEGVRASLAAHFFALPMRDRCLRFGAALAPEIIAAYVAEIDFRRDAVLGLHDDRLALAGVAHVAFVDDLAEVGLSVLPAHRRRGIGGALFKRAIAHARRRRIPRLFMQFLSGNVPIMRIAQRSGMDIVIGAGGIADAHLKLPPASPAAIAGEIVTDIFALCHRVLKASVAA
jgi:GNAT superfamily N-acetyltransferase